jgi:hypothetical protein
MIRRAARLKAAHQARVKIVPVAEQQVDHTSPKYLRHRGKWRGIAEASTGSTSPGLKKILGTRCADPSHLSLISR